jgi:hypothetical protein
MTLSPRIANEIARLMRDPDALRPEWERMQRERAYDPNQPRVPAGNAKGGQWTSKGGGAGPDTPVGQDVGGILPADGSAADIAAGRFPLMHIQAQAQQRSPNTQPRRFPNPIEFIDAARLALYNEHSRRNGTNQQAIIEFRAAQYGRKTIGIEMVRTLSRSDVEKLRDRFEDIQRFTDTAVALVRSNGGKLSPQQFGTAVHLMVKNDIVGLNDPYLKAERSFLKGIEDGYGVKDTARIDGFGRVRRRPDTACIYDIKTGESGLSFPRMMEMVVNSQLAFNGAIRRFIVTEVRPSR